MTVSAPQHSERHTSPAGRFEASCIRPRPPTQHSRNCRNPATDTTDPTAAAPSTSSPPTQPPQHRHPPRHRPNPSPPPGHAARTDGDGPPPATPLRSNGEPTRTNHPSHQRVTRVRQHHVTRQLILEVLQSIAQSEEGAGLEHVPSGNFSANSVWLCCAVFAHNLVRWTAATSTEPTAETPLSPGPAESTCSPCLPHSSTAPAPVLRAPAR
jgi:hypothetical protein